MRQDKNKKIVKKENKQNAAHIKIKKQITIKIRGWKNTNKRQTRCERKKKRQNKMPKKKSR